MYILQIKGLTVIIKQSLSPKPSYWYKVTSNLSQDNSPRRHRFKMNRLHYNLFPME